MSSRPADELNVEQVLDELIDRLARAEPTKAVRVALIEARRLRNHTARWSAIPPPEDARREMLTRVMDLVAMTSGEPSPDQFATVSGAHRAIRRALPTPMPSAAEQEAIAPAATAGSTPLPHDGQSPRRSAPPIPSLSELGRDPSAPPPPPRLPELEEGEVARDASKKPPLPAASPSRPSGVRPPPPKRAPSGALPIPLPPPPLSDAPPPRPSRPSVPDPAMPRVPEAPARRASQTSMPRLPSRPPPPAPFPSTPPPALAAPGQGRTLRAPIAPGITLVRPDAAPWRPFPKVPDVTVKLLFRNPQAGLYTALLKLEAGACLPAHRHAAVEEMYVVDGVAMVGETEMCAGDYCRSEPGSVHETIRTAVGCTILLMGSERDEVFDVPPKVEP